MLLFEIFTWNQSINSRNPCETSKCKEYPKNFPRNIQRIFRNSPYILVHLFHLCPRRQVHQVATYCSFLIFLVWPSPDLSIFCSRSKAKWFTTLPFSMVRTLFGTQRGLSGLSDRWSTLFHGCTWFYTYLLMWVLLQLYRPECPPRSLNNFLHEPLNFRIRIRLLPICDIRLLTCNQQHHLRKLLCNTLSLTWK